MSEKAIEVGQHWQYILKRNGQEFSVDAEIKEVRGHAVRIRFRKPEGSTNDRWLRDARARARLRDCPIPRPGAPRGNRNAVKGELKIGVYISFGNGRQDAARRYLESAGQPVTTESLRTLTYAAVDERIQFTEEAGGI
jgi:hypothetical protein